MGSPSSRCFINFQAPELSFAESIYSIGLIHPLRRDLVGFDGKYVCELIKNTTKYSVLHMIWFSISQTLYPIHSFCFLLRYHFFQNSLRCFLHFKMKLNWNGKKLGRSRRECRYLMASNWAQESTLEISIVILNTECGYVLVVFSYWVNCFEPSDFTQD